MHPVSMSMYFMDLISIQIVPDRTNARLIQIGQEYHDLMANLFEFSVPEFV